jgi:hypothetical protein
MLKKEMRRGARRILKIDSGENRNLSVWFPYQAAPLALMPFSAR